MNNTTGIKHAIARLISPHRRLKLPISFIELLEPYKNIRLIPYSLAKRKYGSSFMFRSDDAEVYYSPSLNRYIIYFNDLDDDKKMFRRHRFSIAHEIGHIFLGHLNDERTTISRGGLSYKEYREIESEADKFAAFLLTPFAALQIDSGESVKDHVQIRCLISKHAAAIRAEEFLRWQQSKRDWYDRVAFRKFQYRDLCKKCTICNSYFPNDIGYEHCPICGNWGLMVTFNLGEHKMTYNKIELNEYHKAIECPVCGNAERTAGDYCHICGKYIVNKCNDEHNCGRLLPGDARYCYDCGTESTFLLLEYLTAYDYIEKQDKDFPKPESEDIPF